MQLSFQRYTDETLRVLDFCDAYLDDILVASTNEEEHIRRLRTEFQRLTRFGITLNPTKCLLGRAGVKFLGCAIQRHQTTRGQGQGPRGFPLPATVKELRRFLGMMNRHRRFIPRFS